MEGFQQPLIGFRFGTAVLVADSIFVEHFGHFFGNHVAVVRDGNQRDFLAWLRLVRFRRLGLFRLLSHVCSIHQGSSQKWSYSKASSEDCWGKVRLQLPHVKK